MSPPQASTFAAEHDALFYLLSALTLIFTLIVGVCVVAFAIRYREGSKADRSRPVYEDLRLELTWTIIPTLLGLVMFAFGAHIYINQRTMPSDAEEVYVIGKQWMWHIQHSNGVRENNTLHVPIDRAVKLTMISQDVIHAFYVPAFRTQYMVVPGRYTQMWFKPTKEGEYHLFCNMYCGTQHSEMGGKVVVMSQKDYANWLATGGESGTGESVLAKGRYLYDNLGCGNCHGAKDNYRAPSLVGIFGKQRTLNTGHTVVADMPYMRDSILHPYDQLVAGYGQTMPVYDKQISEEGVLSLITYIRSMDASATAAPAGESAVANERASMEKQPVMQVGADRYKQPDVQPTPTRRKGNLSVGAIAAEGGKN